MDIVCNRISTFYAILLHRDMKIISILQFENEMTICKGIQRVIECVSALYEKKTLPDNRILPGSAKYFSHLNVKP